MARWNEELFPDHVAFLKGLHDRQLKTTLNTHPADGVRAFEKPYEAMCKAVGRDSTKGVVSHPSRAQRYIGLTISPFRLNVPTKSSLPST
jgi:hypothetical protein